MIITPSGSRVNLMRSAFSMALSAVVYGLLYASVVAAAEAPAKKQPPVQAAQEQAAEVPGDDIFGFTSTSDTGTPGEKSFALESTTRFGKADGVYVSPSVKIEFGYSAAENLWVALSPFISQFRIRDVTGLDSLNRTRFDGISTEIIWRFLPRTASGLAASFSVEPRWAQLDGATGTGVNALSAEFKFYIDQVLIPDTLFAALNLNYQPGSQQAFAAGSPWIASSQTNISAGLTYQVNPQFFIGIEARYLAAFDGAFLDSTLGTAFFFGPNFTYKFSEKTAFNVGWTPQLWGHANGTPGRLDLTNFERHQLRAKFAATF